MAENQKPEPDDKKQSERFIETAREFGADKDEGAFEKVMDIITSKKVGDQNRK